MTTVPAPSFVEATASATGASESTIERNARRGRLGDDVLRRLAGTKLDTGVGLDSLLALSVDGVLTPEGEAKLVAAEAARDAPAPAALRGARFEVPARLC